MVFLKRSFSLHRTGMGSEPAAVVYTVADEEDAHRLALLLEDTPCVLCAIHDADWNDDLSPWPAEAVFSGQPFGGHADRFLRRLTQEIVPACEGMMELPENRIIAGYSLGGLFALWSTTQTSLFNGCACVSGSLWYDGFTEWLPAQNVYARHVYLSVGDRECRSRNPRLQRVEQAVRETKTLLDERGIQTVFRLNPGNHFQQTDERLADGIRTLISEMKEKTLNMR